MNRRAAGTFHVDLAPTTADRVDSFIGMLTIDKRFDGDLVGTSRGLMLAASTGTPGSAVYVAMEKIDGTLEGRGGTFVLHHTGVMNRGDSTLSIAVVPDSGTADLTGLSGTMTIDVIEGLHRYELDYEI